MGLDVGIGRDGQHCHDVWWRNGVGGRFRYGGADVLTILTYMAFCGGERLGQVLAHQIQDQARPNGEITGMDGLHTSGDNGDRSGTV